MITLLAPAKINLYLRMLAKRPDGYHEIETLFERIDLADEVTFRARGQELRLTCTDPSLSCGEDNLVLKAARLLRQASGAAQGAEIHLTKRIPIAAGLGGGSSDAASTLVGLNTLWRLGFTREQLIGLAGQLGSDVPFFLLETPFAIGRGRGERCEPVSAGSRLAQVLVTPRERLSTKEVYAGARAGEYGRRGAGFALTGAEPSISMVHHAISNGSLSELAQGLWNDLEPEAIRRCPLIARIQSQLREAGCLGTLVSGSGSSVFALCRDVPHAQALVTTLRRHAPQHAYLDIIRTASQTG